jgi:transcription initiation factor IIE alpha subunit
MPPSLFPWPEAPSMGGLIVICGNCETRFPYSEKIFKEIEAQNFCPACRQQLRGFNKIIHYLEKKRELKALERELEEQEGFKVESED